MTILAPFATKIPAVRQPMPLVGDRRDLAVQPPHCVLIVLAIAGSVYPRLAEDAQAMLVCFQIRVSLGGLGLHPCFCATPYFRFGDRLM
jgi:hypothetical protein